MPEDDPDKLVFMRIQPDIATLPCKLDPTFSQFLYADASFGVHPDFKSHSGVSTMSGRGMFYCSHWFLMSSNKQFNGDEDDEEESDESDDDEIERNATF